MIDIPTAWPTQIVAGDTLKFKVHSGDFDPSTDTLHVYVANSNHQVSFSSTADGDYFLINVPYSTTQNYSPGDYYLKASVLTGGDEKYSFYESQLEIVSSLQFGTSDPRSHTKKLLDAIEALLEGKVTKDAQIYEIAGRRLEKIPIPDLILLQKQYRSRYQTELMGSKGNKVKVKFTW